MTLRIQRLFLLLSLAAAPTLPVRAAVPSADSVAEAAAEPTLVPARTLAQSDADYDQALEAMREGRHTTAVNLLEELVRRMPAHAGAWLDLGIAFCDLGRAADAERVFAHILSAFAPGDAIRDVIAHYRASGCAPRALGATAPAWEFRLGGGWSSNVNQGISDLTVLYGPPGQSIPLTLSDEFRPQGAAFASADVFHRRPLDPDGLWQWDTGLRMRNHDGLSSYDTALAFTGLVRRWTAAGWRGEAQAGVSALWLGGRTYQQGVGAGIVAWRPVADGWATGLEFDQFRYRYPDLSRYDNSLTALGFKLRRLGKGWQASAGAGWAVDHAPDRPGGSRAGPVANFRFQALLSEDLSVDLMLMWRRLDEHEPYNPLLWEGAIRAQRQTLAQLAFERRLGARDAVRLELNRIDARDTLPIFAYGGTSLGLTWIRTLRDH